MSPEAADSPDSKVRNADLHAQLEKLARRTAELERFVFTASHDLQEPVRMILLSAQLVSRKSRELLDDDAAFLIASIVEGAARMDELLADLLSFAELGNGPQTPAMAVELNTAVRMAVQNLKSSIDGSGAVITSDPLPVVEARLTDLVRLFQNLLSNAIKYRGEAPARIHISMSRAGMPPQFEVADNGIGIDPKDHRRIFEPFRRLHDSRTPGTGLGLAICERIVERYSGRIWVESAPGKGATFVFTLPDTLRYPAAAQQFEQRKTGT